MTFKHLQNACINDFHFQKDNKSVHKYKIVIRKYYVSS